MVIGINLNMLDYTATTLVLASGNHFSMCFLLFSEIFFDIPKTTGRYIGWFSVSSYSFSIWWVTIILLRQSFLIDFKVIPWYLIHRPRCCIFSLGHETTNISPTCTPTTQRQTSQLRFSLTSLLLEDPKHASRRDLSSILL